MTKIEWVKNPDGTQGITLNPIRGLCPMACPYCYARRMYKRFGWGETPRYVSAVMEELRNLKNPTGVFICSTFEWLWDDFWAQNIVGWIKNYPQHRFYLLTKLPEKLPQFSPFPDNCWVGVTVCNSKMLDVAVDKLEDIEAKVKFISFEPLLEKLQYSLDYAFYYSGVSWVIIGAQTPYSRKTAPRIEWVKEIVESCDKANIPIFLKDNLLKVVNPELKFPSWAYRKGIYRQEFPCK